MLRKILEFLFPGRTPEDYQFIASALIALGLCVLCGALLLLIIWIF
jgi:hypothetical protein